MAKTSWTRFSVLTLAAASLVAVTYVGASVPLCVEQASDPFLCDINNKVAQVVDIGGQLWRAKVGCKGLDSHWVKIVGESCFDGESLVSQAIGLVAENQNTGAVAESLKQNLGSLADLGVLGLTCQGEGNDVKGTLENLGAGTPVEPPAAACGCASEIEQALFELAEDGAPVAFHDVIGDYFIDGGCDGGTGNNRFGFIYIGETLCSLQPTAETASSVGNSCNVWGGLPFGDAVYTNFSVALSGAEEQQACIDFAESLIP